MSSSLVPLKIRHAEGANISKLKHAPVGVMWKLIQMIARSGVILVAGLRFKITRSVTNSSRAALKCDVNITLISPRKMFPAKLQ
ncbi:hypothetical protein TNCV_3368061 [Trichonephila clavipes]|nr:hypothetical protein TNCV_3368061 [Trichonephila clavipes]